MNQFGGDWVNRIGMSGRNTISSVAGGYRSAVTKHCNRLGFNFGWQPRFYDHIIRDDQSLNNISNYIIDNLQDGRKMIKGTKTNRKTPPEDQLKELMEIPGVGKSIAADLLRIGITRVADLKGKNPQALYDESNALAGVVQDRCLLYTFRCAVYYANTVGKRRDPEKLKWWNWKDKKKTLLSGEF